jgi:hypothetical protein
MGCGIRVTGCVKIWRSTCGRDRRADAVLLLASALGGAKEMALVDHQATIGRETNEAVCIIPALDVQHPYRIILDTNISWLDAKIHCEIFFRLARHLKTRRRARKFAKRRASVQRQGCAEQRTHLRGIEGADRRCSGVPVEQPRATPFRRRVLQFGRTRSATEKTRPRQQRHKPSGSPDHIAS